jgi:hypothetical protein
MPVMKTEEQPAVRLKDKPTQEKEEERAARQRDSMADEAHSGKATLLAEKRPTTVIIPPSNCFPNFCPVAGLTLISRQSA